MADRDDGAPSGATPRHVPPPIFTDDDEPSGQATAPDATGQPAAAVQARTHLPPLPPVPPSAGADAGAPEHSAGASTSSAPLPPPVPPAPEPSMTAPSAAAAPAAVAPSDATPVAEPVVEPAVEPTVDHAAEPAIASHGVAPPPSESDGAPVTERLPVAETSPAAEVPETPAIAPMRTADERAAEAGERVTDLPSPDEDLWPAASAGAPEPVLDIPQHRRWPLVTAAIVAALAVVIGLAFAASRLAGGTAGVIPGLPGFGSGSGQSGGGLSGVIGTGPSTSGTGTKSADTSGGGVAPPAPHIKTGPAPKVQGIKLAALVAYRSAGAIWVSGERGENPRKVLAIKEGHFALSPDGTRLAAVDAHSGVLVLANLETSQDNVVAPALDIAPSWAPDSSFFVYTASSNGKRQINHATRAGAFDATLGDGVEGQVAVDWHSVFFIQSQDPAEGGILANVGVIPAGGGTPTVVTRDRVVAFAPGRGVVYYATGQGATASIWRVGETGSGATRIVGPPTDARQVIYSDLRVSPDGKALVFARTSDDGYSRMEIVATKGGAPSELSGLRDDYPLGWTTDGSWILFVDGNAIQGEKTDVLAVAASGGQRRTVVAGGGL